MGFLEIIMDSVPVGQNRSSVDCNNGTLIIVRMFKITIMENELWDFNLVMRVSTVSKKFSSLMVSVSID